MDGHDVSFVEVVFSGCLSSRLRGRWLPISNGCCGLQYSLDHPALHALVVDNGEDVHPDDFIDLLEIIWEDRHTGAVAEGGNDEPTWFFTDERAASLRSP